MSRLSSGYVDAPGVMSACRTGETDGRFSTAVVRQRDRDRRRERDSAGPDQSDHADGLGLGVGVGGAGIGQDDLT